MKKLTIIIPSYNSESSIKDTVYSVYRALEEVNGACELIVVNDGASDSSPEILDGLADVLGGGPVSFRVIHQRNQGCYMARLAGLRAMCSEYFGFVDSDDGVLPEIYRTMLEVAELREVDVVQCGWQYKSAEALSDDVSDVKILKTRSDVFVNYINPVLFGVGESAYVWNKLYRFKGISDYVEGDYGSYEDLIHNLHFFRDVNSMAFVNNRFYLYAPTDASVTRRFNLAQIDRLKNTKRAKGCLSLCYFPVEPQERIEKWYANEVMNHLIKAAVFGVVSNRERLKNISVIKKMGIRPTILRYIPSRILMFIINILYKIKQV